MDGKLVWDETWLCLSISENVHLPLESSNELFPQVPEGGMVEEQSNIVAIVIAVVVESAV